MKLGPLPPKPPLLPPYWWLAPLAAFLSAFALFMNVSCAYDYASAGADGSLALHCALIAWILMALVSDMRRTITAFRKWHALRVDWEELRKLREHLEHMQQEKQ